MGRPRPLAEVALACNSSAGQHWTACETHEGSRTPGWRPASSVLLNIDLKFLSSFKLFQSKSYGNVFWAVTNSKSSSEKEDSWGMSEHS